MVAILFAGIASLVVRYRRSRGTERQQLKWFVYGAAMPPLALLGNDLFPSLSWLIGGVGVACVPVAIGIAVLKYRLYDIDVIVNRTLVYGALTACVVGIYVLVVGYLGALFRSGGDLPVSLVATGIVAVLFAPLRDRLQRAANRLMYGERDDPYAVLSRLGRRLETTLAPEATLRTVVEITAQALKLPYAAINLKRDDGEFVTAAQYGEPADEPITLPLAYGSELVGQLILSPRSPGEAFSPSDKRLLDDLARQAGVAVHAARLTADLQRSRERLVTAREEERRRLRRDLHDGLGPRLAAQTLKVGSARMLFAHDPAAADALLEGLETDMEAALSDIRRLVYDLRPPALDELGLAGAIRETAARYDTNGLRTSVDAPERLPALPAAVEVAVYRIVGEALANVVRHANARSCAVRLSASDGELLVEVSDDGVGLSAGGARAPGVGLYSMRERAEELGGSCRIESPPAGGTRVFARLPLEASSFGQRAPGKSKESVAAAPGFPTRGSGIDPGMTKTKAKIHEDPKPDV
jgi:signal transduction histidine kinase